MPRVYPSKIPVTCRNCGTVTHFPRWRFNRINLPKYCSRNCKTAFAPKLAAERFWRRVTKTPGCWLWTGTRDEYGYGVVWANDSRNTAHRYSYRLHFGNIPDGLCVLHRCDNRVCVRPDHFFLGTNQDNMNDMVAKQRQCRGESMHSSKMTVAKVIEMRRQHDEDGRSIFSLSKEYGIHNKSAHDIIFRKTWKHV